MTAEQYTTPPPPCKVEKWAGTVTEYLREEKPVARNTAVRMTKLKILFFDGSVMAHYRDRMEHSRPSSPSHSASAVGHRRTWAVWPASRKILPGVPRPQKGGVDCLKTDVIGWLSVSSGKIDLTARGQSRPQCLSSLHSALNSSWLSGELTRLIWKTMTERS